MAAVRLDESVDSIKNELFVGLVDPRKEAVNGGIALASSSWKGVF